MNNITALSGYGLGLRRAHYESFLAGPVPVDFVEVISENYMVDGGNPLRVLESVRQHTPVILHGVSMSIGSADGLDSDYLRELKKLAARIEPLWLSDHICWTRTHAHNSHDLLPMPYTLEALQVVCDNVHFAQETLERELVLENPSSYLTFPGDEMTEWEFIAAIADRTGCHLLLDINNVVVSAHNHGFSDQPVASATWELFARTQPLLGDVAVMIERDDNIPALDALLAELAVARDIARGVDAQRMSR